MPVPPKATRPISRRRLTRPAGGRSAEPDLVLRLPEPFVVPAGEDVYRAFALPIPLDRTREVAAVEFRPGNRRVVHHARYYLDPTPECRRRDEADPGPGFATVGGNDIPKSNLGAWCPGATPRLPPPGIRIWPLPAGLRPRPPVALPQPREARGRPFERRPLLRQGPRDPLRFTASRSAPTRSTSPPERPDTGSPSTRPCRPTSTPTVSCPTATTCCARIKLWAVLPDGTTRRLLWIDDWDMNWQGVYHFAEPVALPRGTKLHVVATYDNSDANTSNPNRPPKRVRFGPASTDEMLGFHPGTPQTARRRPGDPEEMAMYALNPGNVLRHQVGDRRDAEGVR